MNTFLELFEGTFANKRQAQSHPTRYAHIRVSHRRIGETRFYGEQAYNYQFGHSFYFNYGFKSENAQILIPILERLNPTAILRIKGTLLPRSEKTIEHGYHLDNESSTSGAIYYINTNNGYTKFKEGGKIDSVANRLVLFNTDEYHTGATCTDEKVRVLINFNYYS